MVLVRLVVLLRGLVWLVEGRFFRVIILRALIILGLLVLRGRLVVLLVWRLLVWPLRMLLLSLILSFLWVKALNRCRVLVTFHLNFEDKGVLLCHKLMMSIVRGLVWHDLNRGFLGNLIFLLV
jgi:hypothetical protein